MSDSQVKALGLQINIGIETRIWPHAPKLGIARTFETPSGAATQGAIVHNNLKISQDFGGYVALINRAQDNLVQRHNQPLKIRLSGAIEALNFTLGQTTREEWAHYQDLARHQEIAPSVMLQNDYLTVVGSLKFFNINTSYDQMVQALEFWQDLILISKYFNYKENQNDFGHQFFQTSRYTVTSLVVNLGNGLISAPASWFSSFTNYQGILRHGAWGASHEINHSHQSISFHPPWGSDKGRRHTEVTNNSLSILAYMLLTNVSQNRQAKDNHHIGGWLNYTDAYDSVSFWKDATFHKENLNKQSLSFYTTLQHNFGPYTYLKAFRSYSGKGVSPEERQNKAKYWVYQMSLALKMDLRDYYAQVGAINLNEYSAKENTALDTLATYHPLGIKYASAYACSFEQSSSPYAISPDHATLLDLNKWTSHGDDVSLTFSDLKATWGTITPQGEGRYLYTPHQKTNQELAYRVDDLLTFKVALHDKATQKFLYNVDVEAKLYYDSELSATFSYSSYQKLSANLGNHPLETVLDNLRSSQEITFSNEKTFITNPDDVYNMGTSGRRQESFLYKITFVAPTKGNYQFQFWADDAAALWEGNIDLKRNPDKIQSSYSNQFKIIKAPVTLEKGAEYPIWALVTNNGGAASFHLRVREDDKAFENVIHNKKNQVIFDSPYYHRDMQFIPPTLNFKPQYLLNEDLLWSDLKNLKDFAITYEGPLWANKPEHNITKIFDQNLNTYFHAAFSNDPQTERVINIKFW